MDSGENDPHFLLMGYIGMCVPKRYGFLAVLVINRVWFLHSSFELDMFSRRRCFSFR